MRERASSERPRGRALRAWVARGGLLLPVLVLLGVLAVALVRHQQTLAIEAALARGDTPPVPEVTLPGLDGPPVSLASLRGHPVILNFWASWCVPCRQEAPLLEATWREFQGRGLLVLGVATQDLDGAARDFIREVGITYPNVRDPDGSVARLFGTTGVPETFFIGSDGRIRGHFPGPQTDRAPWRAAAEALLAGRSHVP